MNKCYTNFYVPFIEHWHDDDDDDDDDDGTRKFVHHYYYLYCTSIFNILSSALDDTLDSLNCSNCGPALFKILILWSFWRGSTRLQHPLHKIKPDSSFTFVFCDGKEVEHICVAHIGGIAVSMLVRQPLPFVRIGVSSSNVFRLQMFQLTVNVVSVAHVRSEISEKTSMFHCIANIEFWKPC